MLSQPTLLYDGTCGFCRASVERLQQMDPRGVIRSVPSAERHGIADLPRLTDEDLDRAMHFVSPDGSVSSGARALPPILACLPGWRWLRMVFAVPGVPWLADRVYSGIAKRRHRFGCGSHHCRIGQRS